MAATYRVRRREWYHTDECSCECRMPIATLRESRGANRRRRVSAPVRTAAASIIDATVKPGHLVQEDGD